MRFLILGLGEDTMLRSLILPEMRFLILGLGEDRLIFGYNILGFCVSEKACRCMVDTIITKKLGKQHFLRGNCILSALFFCIDLKPQKIMQIAQLDCKSSSEKHQSSPAKHQNSPAKHQNSPAKHQSSPAKHK